MKTKSNDYRLNNKLKGREQTTLDVFRILAAIFVMVGHGFSFFQISILKDEKSFPYIQNIGVVVFFLVSGFLTAFSLSRKNESHNYSFKEFILNKINRIYREYLPGLVLIAIIDAISIIFNKDKYAYYNAFNLKEFIGNAFMLQNMGPNGILGKYITCFGSGRPLWTLSVEWWFYMLFGVLYLYIANKEKVSFLKLVMFAIIVCMSSGYLVSGGEHSLGFVFALGVLAYYCYRLIRREIAYIILPISIALYIAYGIVYKEAYTVYSYIILWFIICSALRVFGGGQDTTKRNVILAFISKSTFMLYLIHYSIMDMICSLDVQWNTYVRFFFCILISLIVSIPAYYVFGEKKIMGKIYVFVKKRLAK